jgi:hypothetical protein
MPRPIAFALRIFSRFILWTALAVFCICLIVLGINARDEQPSVEAQTLLRLPQNRYKAEENIYVALAGLDAPVGQSVVAVGQARIALYNEQLDQILQESSIGLPLPLPKNPSALKFKGKVDFAAPRDPVFWMAVGSNASKVDELLADNRELYERYLALLRLQGYFETERPSIAADVFAPPTQLRNLFLAKFALDVQSGDERRRDFALSSLRQDVDMWRRVLTGEGNLISKMLAVAYLQNDYLVMSDMIADPTAAIPCDMDAFLAEPDLSEWSIGRVFGSEFRFQSSLYRHTAALLADDENQLDGLESPLERWLNRMLRRPIGKMLFKLNATERIDARLMDDLAGFASLDPATFTAQRVRYRKWEKDRSKFMRLQTLYNPTGKTLVAIGAPAYENYLLRPYDAAALQRLVRLSLEIRRQQVAASAIPGFMELHPEWSAHPASGQTFVWDPEAKEIAIRVIAKQPADRRFAVQVWQKPIG